MAHCDSPKEHDSDFSTLGCAGRIFALRSATKLEADSRGCKRGCLERLSMDIVNLFVVHIITEAAHAIPQIHSVLTTLGAYIPLCCLISVGRSLSQ